LKRLLWVTVFFLLGTAVFVSAVPRMDSPETSFNESDAPVNLAPAARPNVRLVPPSVDPLTILPALPLNVARQAIHSLPIESAAVSRLGHKHSLQDILCTFLI
jgi:hypothetical protein